MMPFWWKYAAIGVALLGLGLWIEALRLQVAHRDATIQGYVDAAKLAAQEVETIKQKDAQAAKEISDANDQQVGSMAHYISALLMQRKPTAVPAPADHQAPSTSLADAGAGGQPSGGDHPIAGDQAMCSRSDSAAVLGTALLGWEEVKRWREWAHETGR